MTQGYSFQDVIAAGRWEAALFTTYALSLSFFEAAPLIALKANGCRSTRLLADLDGYRASLTEAGASHVGRSYDVAPVMVNGGVFHPKLALVSGPDGLRAMVGSGNVTFMGWGGNLELTEHLTSQNTAAAFADIAEFLESLPSTPRLQSNWPDLSLLTERCQEAAGTTQDGAVRFIHNLDQTIADQLKAYSDAAGGAQALRIIAPFYGMASGVVDLARRLGVDEVTVGVHVDAPERFAFEEAEKHGLKVSAAAPDIMRGDTRRLHAKLIVVEARHTDIVLSGSANGSQAALNRLANVEAGVLRIIDHRTRLGWSPVERPAFADEETETEAQDNSLVLAAQFDDGIISGRVFGGGDLQGCWQASLHDGRSHARLHKSVDVAANGSFQQRHIGHAADFIWNSEKAVLLRLQRAGTEAAGWVTQTGYLEAVRERGAIAESMIRLIGGSDSADDLAVVMRFFADTPEALLSTPLTQDGASDGAARQNAGVVIDPNTLMPASASERQGRGHGFGAGSSAFAQLLARLKKHIGSLPDPETAEAADEDEENGNIRSAPRRKSDGVKGRHLELLLGGIEKRIRAAAHTPSARKDLVTYLDLSLFATARMVDGPERRAQILSDWRKLVGVASRYVEALDELEVAYAQVVVALGQGGTSDASLHAFLQRHVGGIVPSSISAALQEAAEGRRARALSPGYDANGWQQTVARILATRTPWMDALALWDSIENGRPIAEGNQLLAEPEGETLQEIAAGSRSRERVIPLRGFVSLDYCPRHSLAIPKIEAARLKTVRIGRAANCCRRILLNLQP